MDDFDAGILLVIESSAEGIVEYKDVDALPFKVTEIVECEVRRFGLAGGRQERGGGEKKESFHIL